MKKYKSIIIPSLALFISIYGTISFASYMQDAKLSIQNGELKEAKIHLKNQLKENPSDAEARYLLGEIYLQSGKISSAEKELKKAYELNPEDVQKRLSYAQILLNSRQYKKIPPLLAKPINNTRQEAKRLLRLAYAQMGLKNQDSARKYFNKILEINENSLDARAGLAKIALKNKNIPAIEKQINLILKVEPSHSEALLIKARTANLKGQSKQAIEIYSKILDNDSENMSVYFDRATARLAILDLKGAQNDVNKIKEQLGSMPEVNYIQARIYFENKDYKKAKNTAQEIYKYNKRHYPTILILGISHFYLQNHNQAQKFLVQYNNKFPNHIYTIDLLAKISLLKKNPQQALKYYQKILALDSTNKNAYRISAAIIEETRSKEAAEQFYLTALDNKNIDIQTSIVITNLLERWYIQHAEIKKIIPLAKKINTQYPDKPEALLFLAKAYIVNKKNLKAEKVFYKIITTNKKDIKTRILFAKFLSSIPEKKSLVLKLLDEIYAINTKSPQALIVKAKFLIKGRDYKTAEQVTGQLKHSFTSSGQAEKLKGDILLTQNKISEALLQYQKSLSLNNSDKIILTIIDSFNTLSMHKKAIKFLQQLKRKGDEKLKVQLLIANQYLALEKYSQAITYYENLLETKKDNLFILNNLAMLYSNTNNPKSLQFAEQAYTLRPNMAEVLDTYGSILLKLNKKAKALEILSKASQRSNNKPHILFHYAQALLANKKESHAIKILQYIQTINKPFKQKNEAKLLLQKLVK